MIEDKIKRLWSIYLIGVLEIIMGLIVLYGSTMMVCIGEGCKSPSFIQLLPIYLMALALFILASCLLMYKNWARIISAIGFLVLGLVFIYSSWDFIRTLSTFFDDEMIRLILGIFSLPLAYYLMFNKKVKEAFKKQKW